MKQEMMKAVMGPAKYLWKKYQFRTSLMPMMHWSVSPLPQFVEQIFTSGTAGYPR
jgi:hypothetical protein